MTLLITVICWLVLGVLAALVLCLCLQHSKRRTLAEYQAQRRKQTAAIMQAQSLNAVEVIFDCMPPSEKTWAINQSDPREDGFNQTYLASMNVCDKYLVANQARVLQFLKRA